MRAIFTLSFFYKTLIVSALFICLATISTAQITGKVFRDFNANGTKDNSATFNEVGVSRVEVKAINPLGVPLTVSYTGGGSFTNNTGEYAVSGGILGQIRLEFVLPDGYTFASNGTTGGTTIMFPATATQNLATNAPEDYWNNTTQLDPSILIPHYSNGTFDGPGKTEPGIYSIVNSQGSLTTAAMTPTKITVAKQEEVGAVWGQARDKKADRFFFSSVLKRHVGLGPKGAGGIYIIDKQASSYQYAAAFDLQGVEPSNTTTLIDLGTVSRNTTNSADDNYIPSGTNLGEPGRDLDAFAKVGKVAFGDIDIDDATNRLFAINLNQRSIITVDISGTTTSLNNASAATLKPLTKSYNIVGATGIPTCTTGELRPWGLKIYKGRGYLGIVCDASATQVAGDFKAYILSFDINNIAAGFTTELSVNNYTNYRPWANTWAHTGFPIASNNNIISWRQMVLSDIDFDENGNMIITSLNRFGMQMGFFNHIPVSGNTDLVQANGYSDIFKACYDYATQSWSIGAASCPTPVNGSTSEFYNQDQAGDGADESSNGAIAKLMGSDQVVSVSSDPYPVAGFVSDPQYYGTGGLNWYSTADGSKKATVKLFDSPSITERFGKAIGLGDIEFNLMPQPIEIGNRVFMDTDEDGEQDAGEMGLDGIKVELWKAGAKVTDATTTNNGQWFFTNLDANTAYEVKILSADIPSGKSLTTTNTATNSKDLIDNDASLIGTDAVIAYTTGSAGQNNHSLDFGFKIACPPPTAGINTPAEGTCTGATANNDAKIDFTGITNADKAGIFEGATYTGTDYATTTGTVTAGATSFTGLKHNTQYTVRIFNAANDCFVDVTITTPSKTCVIPCTTLTAGTNTPAEGTCTGATANNDAKIDFTGITNADKAGIFEGATYTGTDYATTTGTVTAGATSFTGLKHNTQYTVRIFNAANDCFVDVTITTPSKTCLIPCPSPNCGTLSIQKL